MVTVSIIIYKDGEAQDGISVELPQVPNVGEFMLIDSQASEPTIDPIEIEHRERNEGRRRLKIDQVSWVVNRSLDLGDDSPEFHFALLECSDAE